MRRQNGNSSLKNKDIKQDGVLDIKVLYVASEAVPFVKTGGLADVAGSLPKALKEQGVDVRVILPKFSKIGEKYRDAMEHVYDGTIPVSWLTKFRD